MPKLYMMIGLPAAGKSTWVANQPIDWNKTVIASTDNYIERHAQSQKKTYNDVFQDTIGLATDDMNASIKDAVENGLDIIWDQTNTGSKARMFKLKAIPDNYEKIALVFLPPDEEEHNRRLANRPGKTIPPHILDSMRNSFQMPTEAEGFDEIRVREDNR